MMLEFDVSYEEIDALDTFTGIRRSRTYRPFAPRVAEGIRKHIESNLDGDLSTAALAAAVRSTTTGFCRAFRATFGTTAGDYVLALRLERACELMRERRLSLTDIALACGLYDQPHLCRHFRQRFGMPPGKWRKAIAAADRAMTATADGERSHT
jgi:AraC-like DNA-binding protein